MARATGRLCLMLAALLGAASSLPHESLDVEALFQKEVRSHAGEDAEDNPLGKLGDMLKGLKVPGAPSGPADAPKAPQAANPFSIPGFPPLAAGGEKKPGAPSMEDMMKIMQTVMKALRNDTIMEALVTAADEAHASIADSTRRLLSRYAAFNETVARLKRKDVIPYTVNFMEGEMDSLKPEMQHFTRSLIKLVRKLPLGSKSREVKLMIGMVEPLMEQGMDDLMRPLKANIEAMGNKSLAAFCVGALPIVINASATLGPIRTAEVELKKMVEQLPKMKSSPMALFMPDVVPKMIKLGEKMLDQSTAMVEHFEAQATQLNTTFRWALDTKLDCDVVIRSASAPRGLGILAAAAALVAWLAAP